MSYIGDYAEDYATLNFKFTTVDSDGAPATLTSGVIKVYTGSATGTESTAGITLAADFDGVTGLNNVLIDLSSNAFYATGADYHVVITTGTVDSVSVVGYVVGSFSIENRYMKGTDSAYTGTPPTSADIADAVWDEILTGAVHNTVTSAGRRLRELASAIILSGTSPNTGGTANTDTRIELDSDASAVDGAYDPAVLSIIAGTGEGQTRQIFEYDGTNKYAYVNRDWKVVPDNTSEYVITHNAGDGHVNEGVAQGGASTTITLNTLASSTDDVYNHQVIAIVAGTGADQANVITDYDGTTQVATVLHAWEITPDATTIYYIIPRHADLDTLKILRNKMVVSVASNNMILYDDDGTTPLYTWALTDKDGGTITAGGGVPTTRGAPS